MDRKRSLTKSSNSSMAGPDTEAPTLHLADIDPDEIFRARWRDRRGGEPTDDFLEAFQELKDEARVALNVDRDQEIAHAKS